DRRDPHARRDPRRPSRLPVRAEVPDGRRAAPRPRRGGRRRARRHVARRADVVLPVAQGAAARPRRRPPRDPPRPRRLRALRQADGHRLLHVRPPLRDGRDAPRGPRPARRDVRGPRLGRPDRAAARGGARRSRRPHRVPRHGPVDGHAADERRVAALRRLRAQDGGSADRPPRPRRVQDRSGRRRRRRLRRALPERRLEGRRARLPALHPPVGGCSRRRGGAGGARRARGRRPPEALPVGGLRPDPPALGRRALRRPDRRAGADRHPRLQPLPPGGQRRADRPAHRRLAGLGDL
ncbi:MAG: Hydrolase, alpha/beta fold family protein, At1g52510/AT4G12830 homolog, group4, partial [uncultured Solirubrobacteraceae bacterium]